MTDKKGESISLSTDEIIEIGSTSTQLSSRVMMRHALQNIIFHLLMLTGSKAKSY